MWWSCSMWRCHMKCYYISKSKIQTLKLGGDIATVEQCNTACYACPLGGNEEQQEERSGCAASWSCAQWALKEAHRSVHEASSHVLYMCTTPLLRRSFCNNTIRLFLPVVYCRYSDTCVTVSLYSGISRDHESILLDQATYQSLFHCSLTYHSEKGFIP